MSIEANIGERSPGYFFLGEDKVLEFTVLQADGVTPQDISGWDLSWMLKASKDDLDVDALIRKLTPTEVYLSDPTAGVCRVTVLAEDTDPIDPGKYFHELKRMDAGQETVLSFGTARLLRGVHRE